MFGNLQIEFSPVVPWPLIAGIAIAALLVLLFSLWRRARGTGWRALAAAGLIGAICNPSIVREDRNYIDDVAVVVVDDSASQQIGNRAEQTAAALAEVEQRIRALPHLELRVVRAGADSTTAGGGGTRLFEALARALGDVPARRVAGAVFISDGQVHDVPGGLKDLGFEAPVHLLLTGAADEVDRRLTVAKAPTYGLVDSDVPMTVRIDDQPESPIGAAAKVTISQDGQPKETRDLPIGVDQEIMIHLDHPGPTLVELQVEGRPNELSLVNNSAVAVINGVRDRLRVLLVSGEPYPGERTWRNILKSDPAVDLVHFTILRPPEKQDGTPIHQLSLIAFPTRELFSERIKDFDLIIFDRYQHRDILQLIYYENIARYVEQGGALLVAAGDDYAGQMSLSRTPLSVVLPATPTGRLLEQPYKAKLSPDGLKHPVTRGLPGAEGADATKDPTWGRWFRQVDVVPSRGRTVMSGAENRPLLVLDRKGRGRVALMLSDHSWLWARGYEGGGPHTDLLRRLSHWLMKEPDLEEERLRASARGLKLTIERRSMEEGVPPVQVSAPGGENSEVTLESAGPGLWRSTVDVKVPGLYKLQTMSPTGQLHAVAHAGIEDAREMSEVTATDAKLKPLVEQTGGGTFWTRGGGLLSSVSSSSVELPRISMLANARVLAGSGWMGLKDREAYVTRGVKLIPMFTGLFALAALLALLAVTWWREGR